MKLHSNKVFINIYIYIVIIEIILYREFYNILIIFKKYFIITDG
mgnify:CR=1 FL=1|jgi:hypothetical protein